MISFFSFHLRHLRVFTPVVIASALLWLGGCSDNTSSVVVEEPDPLDCIDGLAGDGVYPCSNVHYRAYLSLGELNENDQKANDIWGWQDPQTEKEYALVGLTDGVVIVDVTDAREPVYVGKLPEADIVATSKDMAFHDDEDGGKGASAWRDIKTYQNTMYVVTDINPRGMQVFDLEKLRSVAKNAMPVTFEHDAHYTEFGEAHNIAINEASGYAYAVGSTKGRTCATNGGLHIIDIRDRLNPEYAGCHIEPEAGGYVAPGYVHDTQCVIYDGPDTRYQGREICVSSAELRVLVSDMTDKENPKTVSVFEYTGNRYAHQGWFSEDKRAFFLNDELDEMRNGHNTRTYILDMTDLENPRVDSYYQHSTNSIDHNNYVVGNRLYQANYLAGLRVLDVTEPTGNAMSEIGFFDTTPAKTEVEFDGLWSVYPWFENGKIVVSDISQGLFVLEMEP
ncbi:MAG: choice-of-anchor B family protein [Balneolaceae bacterium]|nr:choice-of-anchor B family protein [Balneolaceae bacterium]